MSMQHLKEALGSKGDADLARRVARVQSDFAKRHPGENDIPLPTSAAGASEFAKTSQTALSENESTEGQESPEDALLRVRYEYATKPHTPEFIQESWQTMWGVWIAIAKRNDPALDIAVPQVPDCGRTQQQLETLAQEERGRVYVPQMSYETLAKVFPAMQSDNATRGRIHDNVKVEGWYDFDMSIDAPHLGITESGLRAKAIDGWEVAVGKTYIAATNGSKAFVDRYLDQGNANGENWTWSLLPNSRVGGEVVEASSRPYGRVNFSPRFHPHVPLRYRGGRLQRK